jgi:hypothetical protein
VARDKKQDRKRWGTCVCWLTQAPTSGIHLSGTGSSSITIAFPAKHQHLAHPAEGTLLHSKNCFDLALSHLSLAFPSRRLHPHPKPHDTPDRCTRCARIRSRLSSTCPCGRAHFGREARLLSELQLKSTPLTSSPAQHRRPRQDRPVILPTHQNTQQSSNNPQQTDTMAEFIRAQIFGTTFEITSRYVVCPLPPLARFPPN